MPRLTLEILPPHPKAGHLSFDAFPVYLGRNQESQVAFDPEADRATSWDHAQIAFADGRFVLTDRGSTNGTFVNGQRITTRILTDGDRIELGSGGPQLRVHSEAATPAGDETAKTMIVATDLPRIHLRQVEGIRGRPPIDREFRQQIITMGRDPQNDIAFSDPPHPVVSRFHAEIVLRGGEYQIIDKKATNGTLVNGRRIEQVVLRPGDRITIGEGGPAFEVFLPGRAAAGPPRRPIGRWAIWGAAAAAVVAAILWLWPGSEPDGPAVVTESLSEAQFIEKSVILFARAMNNDIDDVPRSMVRNIQRFTASYARQQRVVFFEKLKRAQDLMPPVQRILRDYGMPGQLAYIAFQESRFDPAARSKAGAVGLWQFMKPTGREYGLRIEGDIDERLDPLKSTDAAARYLKKLYLLYGDFMLALAAYNLGPGNVNRALGKIIEDQPPRNRYWYLVKKDLLPKETDEYVNRIIAGWIVASNPERFGFPAELAAERGGGD